MTIKYQLTTTIFQKAETYPSIQKKREASIFLKKKKKKKKRERERERERQKRGEETEASK